MAAEKNLKMTTRRENVSALIVRARQEDASLSTVALGALLLVHEVLAVQPHEQNAENGSVTEALKKGVGELIEKKFLVKDGSGWTVAENWPGEGDVDVEDEDLGKLPKRANEPRAIGQAKVGGIPDVPLEAVGGVDVEDAR